MRTIYLILIIFFLSLNLRPSITSVGPLLDFIQTDLGMSSVTASLLTTLPVFCMGLFALLSIKMSNDFGIEKSLLFAMALIFLSTFLRGFAQTSFALIATALIVGIGIGIAGPLISGFIKKYFPTKLSVASVYSLSMVIGAGLATTFSIPLTNRLSGSWQWSLSFWSIFALIAFILLAGLKVKQEKKDPNTKIPSIKITYKRVYLFMLLFGLVCTIFYAITAWLAPFIQSMGMTPEQSGLVLSLFTAIQIPVSFIIPMTVSKFGQRKLLLFICCAAELIGILLLIGYFSPWIAAVFLGLGAGGLFPLALLIPIQESTNADEATTWSAQMQFGGFIIGSMGPLVFGFALDLFHSYVPAFIILIAILGIMMVTIIALERGTEHTKQFAK